LWIAAAGAVLLVVALVLALVVVNGSSRNQTTVSPLPETPSSSTTTAAPSSTPSATSSTESSTESSQTTVAGPTEAVVYNVTGEGRAISITYVDNDGVTQTEFNVALPWNKEVNLPKSGEHHPSVTIVNIGHQVTCSVTVAGVEVRQHTGAGLTICDAAN
jgi:heme/copper-type cytochrome/quinol oxidase subunit 2